MTHPNQLSLRTASTTPHDARQPPRWCHYGHCQPPGTDGLLRACSLLLSPVNWSRRFLGQRERLLKGPYVSVALPSHKGSGRNWFPAIPLPFSPIGIRGKPSVGSYPAPENTLVATDQAHRRIADLIHAIPSLTGLSPGLYLRSTQTRYFSCSHPGTNSMSKSVGHHEKSPFHHLKKPNGP